MDPNRTIPTSVRPGSARPTSARLLSAALAGIPAGTAPALAAGLGSVVAAAVGLVSGSASADTVDLPRFPAVSPDGQEIVFSWRGDLWKVFVRGGLAVRLTSHPQDDLASAWSPDGRLIAFESDRDGFRNIFSMRPDGGGLRQVTELDRGASLAGFGVDQDVLFTATLEPDQFRSPRPYRVSLEGGQPRRVHDAFGSAPAVSPDGGGVLFERGGSSWARRHYRGPDNRDIWFADSDGSGFRKLTSWDGNDGQPRWLGRDEVLFLSDRPGPGESARPDSASVVNLWRMNLAQGDSSATRLTDFPDDVVSFDVSADGKTVVLAVWNALHTLDLSAPSATPQRLEITASADQRDAVELRDVSRNVSEALLSPDGKTLATIAFGDVYVRAAEDKSPTRAVTRTEAREKEIAWSPDGGTLYFVTDETGQDEIRAATVAATRGELRAKARDAALAGAPAKDDDATPAKNDAVPPKNDAATSGAAPAKDGAVAETDPKRWADAVRFDVKPSISSPPGARTPSPSPDGKRLAFRRGNGALIVRDLAGGEERVLVESWDPEISWQWSPDGRFIAYSTFDRNFNSDIHVVPADGSAAPVNVTRHPDNDSRPRWSADGKVLAFLSQRINNESDVWMVYLDKGIEAMTPVELEKYYKDAAEAAKKRKPLGAKSEDKPDAKARSVAKSEAKDGDAPDDSVGEDKTESKSADAAAKDGAAKPAEKPADEPTSPPKPLDLGDAYLRLRRVTTSSGNEGNLELTPGGDRIVFSASDESGGLFSVKWDGTDRKKLGPVGNVQQMTLTGDKLVAISGGRAGTLVPAGGEQKFIDIESTVTIDREAFADRRFRELARTLGEKFYHPTMKGLDWPAVTARYLELARATRTADEFNYVGQRFLGELDASHLGVTAPEPPAPIRQAQGRIGAEVHMVDGPEVAARVEAVYVDSPASRAIPPLVVGDLITAVEFGSFAPRETLDQKLRGRIGKETALTVRRTRADEPGAQPAEFTVLLTPISWEGQRRLAYEDWLRRTREQVSTWSGDRIGYVHIESMNQQELDQFERDLFAAADGKQGLVIDVRNNGGGWTADRLLASIMARPHAYTVPRGMDPKIADAYPQDRLFIQRYAQPMNMLCNEKSFSNAEIIAHAFKTFQRGTLVGQQTYGGVISTDAFTLLDGTTVRLPFRGWYLPDGTDMERHGAKPDLVVPQTPETECGGEDAQLRAAVEDLVRRL